MPFGGPTMASGAHLMMTLPMNGSESIAIDASTRERFQNAKTPQDVAAIISQVPDTPHVTFSPARVALYQQLLFGKKALSSEK